MQDFIKRLFIPILLLLVVLLAFGLGRLSKLTSQTPDLIVDINTEQLSNVLGASSEAVGAGEGEGKYVASRNGTKYHYPWCSGAKRISEANKIWFNTVEEAVSAGYSRAGNCPGL